MHRVPGRAGLIALAAVALLAGCGDDDVATTRPSELDPRSAPGTVATSRPQIAVISTLPTTTTTTTVAASTTSSTALAPSWPSTVAGQPDPSCDPPSLTEDVFDAVPTVVRCADGWALVEYADCGARCEPGATWTVFVKAVDGGWQRYVRYPLSFCKSRVEADGAPGWLLDTVQWPSCDGDQLPIEYVDEPSSGPLERGHVGPRVKALQQFLLDNEWVHEEDFQVDGAFGWSTERVLRTFQEYETMVVDGRAGSRILEIVGI